MTLAAWQLFERLTTGRRAGRRARGYFATYGFQTLAAKLRSALDALRSTPAGSSFPPLLPPAAILAWRKRRDPDTHLPARLDRHLLRAARWSSSSPAPRATCCRWPRRSRCWPRACPAAGWRPAFAIQLALGLALAAANYQHWDGVPPVRASLRCPTETTASGSTAIGACATTSKQQGGLPLRKDAATSGPGDIVVTSELGYRVEFNTPSSRSSRPPRSARPCRFRIIGLESHSGYSTVAKGFLPFEISTDLVDRVRAVQVVEARIPRSSTCR